METLLQDVRYALVTMKRNKGFTTAGLLTLALGIGATTAVFSVVYGVLLRPLPYPEPDRLVRLSEEHPGGNSPLQQPLLSNTPGAQVRLPHTVRQRPAAGIQEDRQHHDGVDRCAMEGRHARAGAIGKTCNAARSGQRRFCVASGVRRQRIA